MSRQARLATCGLALILAAGCGRSPSAPPPAITRAKPKPPAVAPPAVKPVAAIPAPPPAVVFPPRATLLPGDPGLQLVVQGSGENGGRRDLTAGGWTAEPAGIVEVGADGYVRPIRAGTARVRSKAGAASEITVSAEARRPWDFAEDIEPILTRSGCNTGGCHGRADGQNGFHLSLFGYDPEGDYRGMTRDLGERRISKVRPESSLLLAKATGTIPHVGGPRVLAGSEEYRTLLAWIRAGTPYATEKNHGRIASLAVEPAEVRLDEPGDQQLRVVAKYADGHERDVTRLASYRVNDDSVIAIDPAKGKAKLLRRAEADLVVRYESRVVSTRLATIINPGLKFDFAKRGRKNFIDDELFKRLESLKVPPSPAGSDATFLRRVSLDLTGEQPRPEQVRDFLKDADPEKRAKLVDSLLASNDFVLFWQIKLGDMLEITSGRPEFAGQPAITYANWVRKQLIDNTPWDSVVRSLLTSVGKIERDAGGPAVYALEGMDPKVSAEKTAQRFLGLRVRCAQCHDHPFDVWTQDDYFGLAATFAKVERSGGGMPGMMAMNRVAVEINPEGSLEHLRTRKPAEPKILGGERIEVEDEDDPRVALADWMTKPDNPFFARAMANWTWAQLFGKGIADPPDDLSRSNPPVHPELLDALARHFVAKKFDVRDLIRTIATSEAYGLASSTVPGNESDHRLFSHQMPRPLTAHQMADALAQATDVSNQFAGGDVNKGKRAIEIQDPTVASTVLEAFGRCNRVSGCASVANPALSLRQSLLVIGGDVIERKVSAPRGYLSNMLELGLGPDEVVENLYLRALCRPPTSEELAHWTAELSQAKSLAEAAQDLFWALLNSREFAFNH